MTKWLVDAQLPVRLARLLQTVGHDALHTSELPAGNRTTDAAINALSIAEQRVVVSKDADFVQSFHREGRPYKLLLISTGNTTNAVLVAAFERHLGQLDAVFATCRYAELHPTLLVVHS